MAMNDIVDTSDAKKADAAGFDCYWMSTTYPLLPLDVVRS